MKTYIYARIKKARPAMYSLREEWVFSDQSQHLNTKVFNTCVKRLLLYGWETWGIFKNKLERLQIFTNRYF